jgi:tricorn protease
MSAFTKSIVSVLLFASLLPALAADGDSSAAEARLLRFPAIHGNQIVFSYAGDLYTVPAKGGVARRLTADEGYETFPRFSPDGKWLAFTGQYDGNTEVYLMPSEGGIPKRLTYTATLERDDVSDRMGPNNIVLTWRDDASVVFRSRRIEFNPFKGQLYCASAEGGLPELLPLPRGGWCSFSPDRKQLAYNRVFREFRTWKRYRGGQADDIWIYDFATQTTTNLTQNPAQDIFPMWVGNKIYFVSDRDENKRMNLFVLDLKQHTTQPLTRFIEFDVKFPSLGDNAIVFENGGFIYRFDLASGKAQKVPVLIHEDLVGGRGGLKDVSKETTTFDLAPDGSRAVIGARGDVFTVPAKYGVARNLTQTPGVHERNARWSPDGKWIAYVSDASGEDELYLAPQDGTAPPTQLTQNADTYKYQLRWSPDSRKILWSDKKLRLQFVDVSTREVTRVVQATAWEISDFSWSPDSRWIAYAKPEERQMPRVYLYSLASQETVAVTDGWFSSVNPDFSSDGKYLFFVSRRTFAPRLSQVEPTHAYFDMANIYLVTLAKDTPSPFEPKSDEVKIKSEDKKDAPSPADSKDLSPAKADDKKDKPDATKKVEVKVDAEGLSQRITVLPIPASNYDNLASVGDKLFYTRKGSKDEHDKLLLFELDKQKETELGEFSGFEVSADAKKMLVKGDGFFSIIDLPTGKIEVKDRLNLSELKVLLDRRAEWDQIYRECWRHMRDFLYDPNLHQVDWPKIRERYEPLLAHVNHRADLTYLIGEMIGELNVGHTYVGGGDYPHPRRIPLGLLGATLRRHNPTGYFQIQNILQGQNWDKSLRSPLTEIGVDVKPGEYIISVDGKPTRLVKDIFEMLVDKADKPVRLKVNREPQEDGARDVVVVPTANEQPLYYLNWVQRKIEQVGRATQDRVGYVHIPDMGTPGLNEFVKYYYPQMNKTALIVDVRGNGGGNVSPQIIERLRREMVMINVARNAAINVDPAGTIPGPKVLLLDEFSASDGDIVAYRFKKYQLGPVVGKRSWGGVVGIRDSLPLLDGGFLNRPEFSRYDTEGQEWIMEGKGVEPDIFVDNDPAREFAGEDDQLNKAIQLIQEALEKKPVQLPPPPPYPDKR